MAREQEHQSMEQKLAEQLFGHGKPGQSVGALVEKMQADLAAALFNQSGPALSPRGSQEGQGVHGLQQALGDQGQQLEQQQHARGGREM